MDPELLARRRRQTTAGLGVAGLRVAAGRRGRGGPAARPAPPRAPSTTAGGLHDLLAALGRRDAGPRRDDVRQRLVAGVPDAREDRLGRGGDRTHDRFVLEGRQVGPRSPPRTTAMTSQSLRLSAVTARAMEAGAPAPCTVTRTWETRNPNPEPVSWPRKSEHPSVPGLATRPTCSGTSGRGRRALRRSSPSASSVWSSWARFAASCPSNAVTSTSARIRLISPLAR